MPDIAHVPCVLSIILEEKRSLPTGNAHFVLPSSCFIAKTGLAFPRHDTVPTASRQQQYTSHSQFVVGSRGVCSNLKVHRLQLSVPSSLSPSPERNCANASSGRTKYFLQKASVQPSIFKEYNGLQPRIITKSFGWHGSAPGSTFAQH